MTSCTSVTHGHYWSQGQNGDLSLTFPSSVTSWEVVVEFDSPVSRFDFYVGEVTKISETKYKITNKNWNGAQQAGSVLRGQWQIQFSERSTPPQMISANLVSPSCGGGSASTTTTTTTTAAPTTTTTRAATSTPTVVSTTTQSAKTTTRSGSSTCSFDYEKRNSWNSGLDGRITLQTGKDLNGWTIEIKLTGQINALNVYTANLDSFANRIATLSNKNWNGNLAAGSQLILDWQAHFANGGELPTIESVKLNGDTCSSSGSTTVSISSTTTTTTEASTVTTTTSAPVTTTQSISTSSESTSEATTDSTTTISSTSTSTQSTGSCTTDYDYDEVIRLSNLFYQAQRSGPLDTFGDFDHENIPYRGDSCLTDGSDNGVDLTGGYFDGKLNYELSNLLFIMNIKINLIILSKKMVLLNYTFSPFSQYVISMF